MNSNNRNPAECECDDCDSPADGVHAVKTLIKNDSPEWICTDCLEERGLDVVPKVGDDDVR